VVRSGTINCNGTNRDPVLSRSLMILSWAAVCSLKCSLKTILITVMKDSKIVTSLRTAYLLDNIRLEFSDFVRPDRRQLLTKYSAPNRGGLVRENKFKSHKIKYEYHNT
jgi:hypothetical protein